MIYIASMGLNDTPQSNRPHIAFFGCRNAGKSSLVNAVTGQNLCVVSEVKGTTTDPVFKAMEMLPVGPVLIIDTAGIDDEGELGQLRLEKTRQVLNKTDAAILVLDSDALVNNTLSEYEEKLTELFKAKNIPYLVVQNKCDLLGMNRIQEKNNDILRVSAKTGFNIGKLKENIIKLLDNDENRRPLVRDLIHKDDFVLLVVPIDKAAPKGRLILPQQQVIRGILEAGATALVVRDSGLPAALNSLGKKPSLVITDSQAFEKVSAIVPPEIPLTSFSILFARYKGNLSCAVRGVRTLSDLQNNDKVLICEGCTHHRQCDDIGTVKLPRWIREFTSKEIEFGFCSGVEFPADLHKFKMILHCGGCMLNDRETQYRQRRAEDQGIPFTNYGIAIAYINGILDRSIAILSNTI
jgi:[FeFe] hydrogenase H-cluster maturation GTPase HydF